MTAMPSQPEGQRTAIKHGLDLLSRRDHFTQELASRMVDAGLPEEDVAEAILELRTQGLLDDQRLANDRVQRWRAEGRSEAECRARLSSRGVDSEVIRNAVAPRDSPPGSQGDPELDPELQAAIRTLRRSMGSTSRPLSSERLAARLGRRGFEPDTIRAAMRHYGLDDLTPNASDGESIP